MYVRQVRIRRFRGIRELDWSINSRIVCLVGPGDSTKTTILDAIEYALLPFYSLPVTDSDFYGGSVAEPIQIEVAVGELPEQLLTVEKYGLHKRGWNEDRQELVDEPDDACQEVLCIRLEIGQDLEPKWVVFSDRCPQGISISHRDRAQIGLARLGERTERHLAWGRGSAISRLTAEGSVAGEGLIAAACRAARQAIASGDLSRLAQAALSAGEAAERLGVRRKNDQYRPGLDTASVSIGSGALALYDGDIPVRALGLGSRRLVALAVEWLSVRQGAIMLIDEVEAGLEPHRIRRLLKRLRDDVGSGTTETPARGQVIMTTHSPVVGVELPVEHLRVVRATEGATVVRPIQGENVQAVVRSSPEAIFGRKVLLCEGPTEVGLVRGLRDHWQRSHDCLIPEAKGVVFADGKGGTNGPPAAIALARLGYDVLFFGDSDEAPVPGSDEMAKAGVQVVLWDGMVSTEQRLANDLPLLALQAILDATACTYDADCILQGAKAKMCGICGSRETNPERCAACRPLEPQLSDWMSRTFITEQIVRQTIGLAAKKAKIAGREGWFKRTDLAEEVGSIMSSHLATVVATDLGQKIGRIETWCYGD